MWFMIYKFLLLHYIYSKPLSILASDVGRSWWHNTSPLQSTFWRRKISFHPNHRRYDPIYLRLFRGGDILGDSLADDVRNVYDEMDTDDDMGVSSITNEEKTSEASSIIQSFEMQLRQIRHEMEEEAFRELENIKTDILRKQQEHIAQYQPVTDEQNPGDEGPCSKEEDGGRIEQETMDQHGTDENDDTKGEMDTADADHADVQETTWDDMMAPTTTDHSSPTDINTPTSEPFHHDASSLQKGHTEATPEDVEEDTIESEPESKESPDLPTHESQTHEVPFMVDDELKPTATKTTTLSSKKEKSQKGRGKGKRKQGHKKKRVKAMKPPILEESTPRSQDDRPDSGLPSQDETSTRPSEEETVVETLHEEDQDLISVIRENVIQLLVTIVLMAVTHFLCQLLAKRLQLLPN